MHTQPALTGDFCAKNRQKTSKLFALDVDIASCERQIKQVLGGYGMERAMVWARNGLALVGVFALGYWLADARLVRASSDDVEFQLQGVNESSSLLVYEPSARTVYVYRGALAGNSSLQCNFKFTLSKPGGAVRRENCPVQSFP
jgi:hypothetical protein